MRTFTNTGSSGSKPHKASSVSKVEISNRIKLTGVFFLVILSVITFYLVVKNNKTPGTNPVWLGIQVLSIDDAVSKNFNLIYKRGLLVRNVIAGSPADDAGIIKGDIIRRIGYKEMINTDQLKIYLRKKSPGQRITIVYIRDGDGITTTTYALLEETPRIDPNTKLIYGTYPVMIPPTNKPYPYFYFGDEGEYEPPEKE